MLHATELLVPAHGAVHTGKTTPSAGDDKEPGAPQKQTYIDDLDDDPTESADGAGPSGQG